MAKKRNYKRKPVKRRRATTTVRRRRTPKENKALQAVSRVIRLIVLIGICGFVLYRLFGPNRPKQQPPPAETVVSPAEEAIIPEEQPVNIDSLPKSEALDFLIQKIFQELNVDDAWIKRSNDRLSVQLPAELSDVTVIWEIIQKIEQINLKVLDSKENLKARKSTITIGTEEEKLLTITFYKNPELKRKAGKIAFIIDDFGYYDNRTSNKYLELKYPITLSVIPGQKHSSKIADKAKQHNKEIMVHIPMEAIGEKVEDSEFSIFTRLSKKEISERIQNAFDSLPGAVGMNNHMGSKATADTAVMDAVLKQVKRMNKFFVDSRTTSHSVVPEMARKLQVKFSENGAFLERKKGEDEDYIRRKIKTAAKIAQKRGTVIAIGHPYKETLNVLSEELPKLEKQGFTIVPISKIIN